MLSDVLLALHDEAIYSNKRHTITSLGTAYIVCEYLGGGVSSYLLCVLIIFMLLIQHAEAIHTNTDFVLWCLHS